LTASTLTSNVEGEDKVQTTNRNGDESHSGKHNLEAGGSNPPSATFITCDKPKEKKMTFINQTTRQWHNAAEQAERPNCVQNMGCDKGTPAIMLVSET